MLVRARDQKMVSLIPSYKHGVRLPTMAFTDCSRIYVYELGREETDLRKREKIDSKRLSDEE